MTDFRGYCYLCGDPAVGPVRWWDSDDGWKVTRLCRGCRSSAVKARPKATDYAVATRGIEVFTEFAADESEAIDALHG